MTTMADDPTARATREAVRRFNEAFDHHDADGVMLAMTGDCVFENTFPPPDGERYQGQEAVRGFWVRFFQSSPDARFSTEEMFAAASPPDDVPGSWFPVDPPPTRVFPENDCCRSRGWGEDRSFHIDAQVKANCYAYGRCFRG